MKKTRNEMYWDYFRHSTEDLELMFSTIIEFFTLIFDQEYQNISPVLSESHGIMISDIDSYLQGITPDIINYEEAIKSLETQKGAFYDRLRYLNYVLMNLEDSRGFNDYQLYLNAFFSEDIKLILDEFGEHALLLEFFYPRGNQYLSVIFLPEYDTFKLVYLNVQISFP